MKPFSSLALNRRHLMLGAIGAGIASSFTLPLRALAAGLAPSKLAMGWIPNVEHAGVWIAMENGYFAEEGIDFSFSPGGPNAPDPMVLLAANTANYAASDWIPFLDAYDKDQDLVILGSPFPTSPAALLSLAKKPIREAKDLVGARILGQGPANKTVIEVILKNAGLPLEFEMVPTGFSPEPLLAGDGDAYFCFATNQPITLEGMGMKKDTDFFVTLQDTLGYKVPGGVTVARKSWVEANSALVTGFYKALIKGWKKNAEDPTVAAKLAVEKYGADLGLDINQQIRQNELQIPLCYAAGSDKLFLFDKTLVGGAMTDIAKLSGHANVPAAETLYNFGPLEAALAAV